MGMAGDLHAYFLEQKNEIVDIQDVGNVLDSHLF